jgi:hypothetical protein
VGQPSSLRSGHLSDQLGDNRNGRSALYTFYPALSCSNLFHFNFSACSFSVVSYSALLCSALLSLILSVLRSERQVLRQLHLTTHNMFHIAPTPVILHFSLFLPSSPSLPLPLSPPPPLLSPISLSLPSLSGRNGKALSVNILYGDLLCPLKGSGSAIPNAGFGASSIFPLEGYVETLGGESESESVL